MHSTYWSVVIATSETGVSTKIEDRDGSVLLEQRCFQLVNKLLTMSQTRHSGPASTGYEVSELCTQCKNKVSGKELNSVARYDKKHSSGGRLSLSRSPAPIQVGNTRTTCRGIVNKGTSHSSAHKHMTRMYLLDLFGGLGFVAKATNHVCLRVFVLGTQEGRDKLLFSPEFVRTSPENVSQE